MDLFFATLDWSAPANLALLYRISADSQEHIFTSLADPAVAVEGLNDPFTAFLAAEVGLQAFFVSFDLLSSQHFYFCPTVHEVMAVVDRILPML